MDEKHFEINSEIVRQSFRAECRSLNNHWKGTWQNSYAKAQEQAERHINAPHGKNKFHDVRIVRRTYEEAVVSLG